MSARSTKKKPGNEGATSLPSQRFKLPQDGKAMNAHTPSTLGAAAHSASAIQEAYTAAGNIRDLIEFVAMTAQQFAREADEENYARFHQLRMVLEGAGRLLDDHVDALDKLSTPSGEAIR